MIETTIKAMESSKSETRDKSLSSFFIFFQPLVKSLMADAAISATNSIIPPIPLAEINSNVFIGIDFFK